MYWLVFLALWAMSMWSLANCIEKEKELQLKYETPNTILLFLFSFGGRGLVAEVEVGRETKGSHSKREVQHRKIYRFSVRDLHSLMSQAHAVLVKKKNSQGHSNIPPHPSSPYHQSKSIKPLQKNSISMIFQSEQAYYHAQKNIRRLID